MRLATISLIAAALATGTGAPARTVEAFAFDAVGDANCSTVAASPYATRETLAAALNDAARIAGASGCVILELDDRIPADQHEVRDANWTPALIDCRAGAKPVACG